MKYYFFVSFVVNKRLLIVCFILYPYLANVILISVFG